MENHLNWKINPELDPPDGIIGSVKDQQTVSRSQMDKDHEFRPDQAHIQFGSVHFQSHPIWI